MISAQTLPATSRRRGRFASVWLMLVLGCPPAFSAPADLDPNFGVGGNITGLFAGLQPDLGGMAQQPDGKVVLAGSCDEGANGRRVVCVTRLTATGQIDTTFNPSADAAEQGRIFTAFTGQKSASALAVAVQPDGKILVAGYCQSATDDDFRFCLARYTPDGQPDAAFQGAQVITEFNGMHFATATALVVQADGKIVVLGSCSPGDVLNLMCAARYLPNGSLDTSGFNAGAAPADQGRVTALVQPASITSEPSERGIAVLAQADGKLVLVGQCVLQNLYRLCAVRLLSNGAVDTTEFNAAGSGYPGTRPGTVILPNSGRTYEREDGAVLQADGKMVIYGRCGDLATPLLCATRYRSDGSIDDNFANAGSIAESIGSGSEGFQAVLAEPNGALLAVATCYAPSPRFCALRLQANGSLDASFRSTGQSANFGKLVGIPTTGALEYVRSVARRSDGSILAAGRCFATSSSLTLSMCVKKLQGGPNEFAACSGDIDGDNQIKTMVDSVILARVALGFTGTAITQGITFSPQSTRITWPQIRDYLANHCGMRVPS